MADTLRCPKCDFEIEVSAVLSDQIRENFRKDLEAEMRQKDCEMTRREETLRQNEQSLAASRQALEQEVLDRVAQQRTQLILDAETHARESVTLEIQDLTAQLTESRTKLCDAQAAELQLRKERRDLETQKREAELAINRQLDEERNKIREETKKEAQQESRLREADREMIVSDLRRQIDVLKRKCEQGSQQAQGEVMELEVEDLLRQHFPHDSIEAVPRGTHGGDVLQVVYDNGMECGTILWEAKRTKAWSDGWLPKLRDDQRAAKAHLAALVTLEMPKALSTFGNISGIWVTNRACLLGMAAALRAGLVEVARTRRSIEGQRTKIEQLYAYVSGPEFFHRVEGIVEAFITMKEDLEAERRSIQRLWAKREKQLERAVVNTAGLYGDIGGILGAKLPQIASLELTEISSNGRMDQMDKAPWE